MTDQEKVKVLKEVLLKCKPILEACYSQNAACDPQVEDAVFAMRKALSASVDAVGTGESVAGEGFVYITPPNVE